MTPDLIQIKARPDQRRSELTAVVHREVFDSFPGASPSNGDLKRWSDFRENYHKAQALDVWPAFPLQIDFELNSTCNMRCSFCTHGHERVPHRILGLDEFSRVIDEGEKHGLSSIKLNYINEPLLNKDLPHFVRYAKAHGVLNVYFATNGVLLTEDMSRTLIDAGVTKIMVSLDAVTPETFRLMRSSEKYHQIVANILSLIALRNARGLKHPLVRVNFLRSRLNIHEQEDFLALWQEVADSIGFQSQVGLPGVEDEVFHTNGTNGEAFRCSFPFKLVVIDSGGNILPCCTFSGRQMPLGNIESMSVQEAWLGMQMTGLKELHKRGGYKDHPICNHCIHGTSA